MAINPLAIGGGVVAAAAIVGGGLYAGGVFSSSESQSGRTNPPKDNKVTSKWHTLAEDTGYQNDTYNNKYAKDYTKYLVGVANSTSNTSVPNNNDWWSEVYTKRYKKTAKEGFANLGTAEKLKEACQEAYGAEKAVEGSGAEAKLKVTKDGNTSAKYLETDFWNFCSHGGTKIKTMKENNDSYDGSSTYAKTTNYSDRLISTKDAGTDWFWDLKEKEFFEASTNPAENKTESEFYKLWTEKKTEYAANKTAKFVKGKCEEAYKATVESSETDTTKFRKSDVGKFCTLSGATL